MSRRGALAVACLALVTSSRTAAAHEDDARVVVLDDGEKVQESAERPLAASVYPDDVALVALRGETVAFQAIVEAGAGALDDVRVTNGALCTERGECLDARLDTYVERFVDVRRPTGNDRDGTSLAFTRKAAPSPEAYVGRLADALVPAAVHGALHVEPRKRGALWIDLFVPLGATAGTYRGAMLVRSAAGELASRTVTVRVEDRALPYAAQKTMVYYDDDDLAQRMGAGGDARAARDVRQVLHAHHLSAFHTVVDPAAMGLDVKALRGDLFTRDEGYDGPGEGVGEGILVLGAYGAFGAPGETAAMRAAHLWEAVRGATAGATFDAFLYAIDEACASPWGGEWQALARRMPALRGLAVGVTCGADPLAQAADLVMMTATDLVPARMRAARATDPEKRVWAYNGQRPYAGPLMLDVPATDPRANAWIAQRYDVPRWFYWEATAWRDANAGGEGGKDGFDPYVVAETFHNGDGDHANGDGILLYPGTQRPAGMVDYGVAKVFPSIRLKNLRRGIEDAGYVALARAVDRRRADAVVRRMVPRALGEASGRPSWPERGAAWIDARRALLAIALSEPSNAPPGRIGNAGDVGEARVPSYMSHGCEVGEADEIAGTGALGALLMGIRALRRRVAARSPRMRR